MRTASNISVVLLNWNALQDTCKCLERLLLWRTLQPAIYVVDNGSTDGSADEISRRFPTINLIRNGKNLGFSGGNNAAFVKILATDHGQDRKNKGVLLLNNDANIEEQDVILLYKSLLADSQAGIIGPLLYVDHSCCNLLSAGGRNPARNVNTYWRGSEAENFILHREQPYAVDYVSGTVALLRESLLREVGIMDEQYFFSGEMADWCERIKKRGYQCLVHPQARGWHDMSTGNKHRNTLYVYYSLRNRFLFIRKFHKRQQGRLVLFWLFIGLKGMGKSFAQGSLGTCRALALALYHGLRGRWGDQNNLFVRNC